jgi:hypothetical protein
MSKKSIHDSLRAKLDPGDVAIQCKHKVVIAGFVKAINISRCGVHFSQVQAIFDKQPGRRTSTPIDDL